MGDDTADPAAPEDVRAWQRLDSRPGIDLTLFRVRTDRMVNPRTDETLERLVLETPDWVNVVARTTDGDLLLVRQYRFGRGAVTTEIPGGVLDGDEDSQLAAARELREETGYTSERWRYLGAVEPNPAFHTNLCHHWYAEDARQTHPMELDAGEDIAVLTLSVAEVREQIQAGLIRHSLVISALCRVFDLRAESPSP